MKTVEFTICLAGNLHNSSEKSAIMFARMNRRKINTQNRRFRNMKP